MFALGAPLGVMLQGAILGTGTGLLAVGLVLVYRSSRIVNFAYGAMGGFAAAVGIALYLGRGWPWPVAVLSAVVVGIATGVGVELLVIRRFRTASRLTLTVATIGLAQVLGGMELLVPRVLGGPSIIGSFETTLTGLSVAVDPVVITGNALLLVAVVPVVLGALSWFLLRTDAGIAVRGIADNTERARLLGIPADQLSTLVWSIAGALAALTIICKAPSEGLILDAGAGPQLLLPALAAAVVAGMEDLRRAFVAGVLLGVFDQLVRWNLDKQSASTLLFLAVILVALAVQKHRTSRGTDTDDDWASTPKRRTPEWLGSLPQLRHSRRVLVVLALMAAVVLPLFASASQLNLASTAVVFGIVAISLVLLTGWGGSVSLGQMAIAGFGGLVAANLVARWNVDFFLTLVVAALAGAGVALVLGLPALRVRGLYLAVTTLAFAVSIDAFVLNPVNFKELIPDSFERPVLWGRFDLASETNLYGVCLAALVLTVVVVAGMRRARPGRALLAGRDNHRAAAAAGIATTRTKLMAFIVSGMIAGVAGALNAVLLGGVGYHTYEPSKSLLVFSMAVIGGIESIPGALLGVVVVQLTAFFVPELQLVITGALVLVILYVVPRGLGEVFNRIGVRLQRAWAASKGITDPLGEPLPGETTASGEHAHRAQADTRPGSGIAGDALLSCRGLCASYGPMQVLFGVDLDVGKGEMVALLGTNGAGKSTVLRAICGLLPPDEGTARLDGRDIARRGPEQIARSGVALMPGGRGLFPSLSVEENLRLATWMMRSERGVATWFKARGHSSDGPARAGSIRRRDRIELVLDSWFSRRDPSTVERIRQKSFELFPVLGQRLSLRAGELSGGEQQMLSLAMALAGDPKLLCIDELSLGLAPTVVADLVRLVRRIHDRGTTVVIVEQSVNVALLLAERAVFLEKGQVRFEGPTRDLLDRPDVLRAVFVGTAPVVGASHDARPRSTAGVTLECHELTKRYGGVTAVDGVSLLVRPGTILGLIGHNGAGKTTLFDLISGFSSIDSGHLSLAGVEMTHRPPHRRAIAGLGRSFQEARLYPSLTVRETVAVAFDRHLANSDPLAAALHLPVSQLSEAAAFRRVDEIIGMLGLDRYRSHLTAELSTGTRRIVELACILAQQPAVVLLDEPTAGVAQRDAEALGPLLRGVQQQTGCTLIVIEHDMNLLSGLCDELVALELGRIIARGSPHEVLAHPRVVASYLGTEDATIKRSDLAQAGSA